MPATHQAPLFEKAGDVMLSINSGTQDLTDYSTDLQAAVNITDRIGVGVYSTKYEFSYYNRSNFQEHSYGEFFVVLNPFKKVGNEHHEFVLGIGKGSGAEREQQSCYFSACPPPVEFVEASAEYNKKSVQYTYGVKKARIEAGVALKFSHINVHNYDYERYEEIIREIDLSSKKGVFFEPAIFFRFGLRPIKVEIQMGTSEALNEPGFNYNKRYFSVGLNVRPEVLFRKKE